MEISYDKSKNIANIRFIKGEDDFTQRFLLRSDVHWDSTHQDSTQEIEDLNEAKERNAWIIDNGDLFDVMQNTGDKRSRKKDLRQDLLEDGYITILKKKALERYTPFADRFLYMGLGNHEDAVLKYSGVHLIDELVDGLNAHASHNIVSGGYNGYINLLFSYKNEGGYANTKSFSIYRTHGYGGAAPVTKGVIQTNRRGVWVVDADLVISGHTHNSWMVEMPQERMTTQGRKHKTVPHLQIPSYKTYDTSDVGFEAMKGFAPSPSGAWWLTVSIKNNAIKITLERSIYL